MDPAYLPTAFALKSVIDTAYPQRASFDSAPLDQVPEMGGFLLANNLRLDTRICHKQGVKGFSVVGCNFEIGNNPPYIVFEKTLLNIEPEGTRFFLKKACFQIKRNQKLFINIIMTIDLLFMTIIMTRGNSFASGFAGGILSMTEFVVFCSLLVNFADHAATNFAIKNSTIPELQGAFKIMAGLGKLDDKVAKNICDELITRAAEIPIINMNVLSQYALIYA